MCYIVLYYVILNVHYHDWNGQVVKIFAYRPRNTGSNLFMVDISVRRLSDALALMMCFTVCSTFWNVPLKILCTVWGFGQRTSFGIILMAVALFKRLSSQWDIFSHELRLWSSLHSPNINHKLFLRVLNKHKSASVHWLAILADDSSK